MCGDVQSAKCPAWPHHQSAGFVVLKGNPLLQGGSGHGGGGGFTHHSR